MTGATGNVYCGLHEFEDMAFVLHFLRPADLFVDIGANVGSYSVLAAIAGANVISFEPVPSTFECLQDNIQLNRLGSYVDTRRQAVGASAACIHMMADRDTTNQVLLDGAVYPGSTVDVQQVALDDALAGESPRMIKMDVEGFEAAVIEGGRRVLADRRLHAVIMELNGSGAAYGSQDDALLREMVSFGFTPCQYDPLKRRLLPVPGATPGTGNTLFVRSPADAQALLTASRTYQVQGCHI